MYKRQPYLTADTDATGSPSSVLDMKKPSGSAARRGFASPLPGFHPSDFAQSRVVTASASFMVCITTPLPADPEDSMMDKLLEFDSRSGDDDNEQYMDSSSTRWPGQEALSYVLGRRFATILGIPGIIFGSILFY